MTDTKQWLPSPAVAALLLILIAATVAVSLSLVRKSEKQEEVPLQIVSESGETIALVTDTDTDGDSLKDWEEALWGTDPNNQDTDGDGTPDGAEVDAGRNPNIPAPNDTFSITGSSFPSVTVSSTDTSGTETRTQTEVFSELFITTYLNNKLVGGSFDEQIDSFSKLAIPELPQPQIYTSKDITVTENDQENFVHEYGNAVGGILKKNAPRVTNELLLVLETFRGGNAETLNDLYKTSTAYMQNATDLLALKTPSGAATQHLRVIHAFLLVSRDIEHMALLVDDPLLGTAGLQSYFTTSEELVASLRVLGSYLNSKTHFTLGEDGYILTGDL